MSFEIQDGKCSARLANGDVVRFDTEDEMRAAMSMYDDVEALFGRKRACSKKKSPVQAQKKKVTITIHEGKFEPTENGEIKKVLV